MAPPAQETSSASTTATEAHAPRKRPPRPPQRARPRRPEVDGLLIIDKPRGPTSHDMVYRIRRLLGVQKVGHTGTLDPMATGVLPLVLGRGTKLARYLTGGDKGYLATIKLGVTTDTLDAEGKETDRRPVTCSLEEVRAQLRRMCGEVMQVPPMYSAKKIDGEKLYRLARQGLEVVREPKRVHIHEMAITDANLPEVTVALRCSAGTYVRVIAEQLGQALGCGAHLQALRRTQAGPFCEADAVDVTLLEKAPGEAGRRLRPLVEALAGLPLIKVPAGLGRMLTSGHQLTVANLRSLDLPAFGLDAALVIAHDDGNPIAVVRALVASDALETARRDEQALKTERVLGGEKTTKRGRNEHVFSS